MIITRKVTRKEEVSFCEKKKDIGEKKRKKKMFMKILGAGTNLV